MAKFITKASNDGICWCECEEAYAAFPGQQECPWCGCGWLFSCTSCRKAFTYGKVVEADLDISRFYKDDMRSGGMLPNVKIYTERANYIIKELKPFSPGDEVVYLDGRILPLEKSPARFKGWHSKHSFKELPHRAGDESVLRAAFSDEEYWEARAV